MPYNDPQPYKDAARKAVHNAIRRGELTRPNKCEMCNDEGKPQAHHNDHELQLDISWLCIPCHSMIHRHYGGQYFPFEFSEAVEAVRRMI